MVLSVMGLPPLASRLHRTSAPTRSVFRAPLSPLRTATPATRQGRRRGTATVVASGDGGLGLGAAVSAGALALVVASRLVGGDEKEKDPGTNAVAAGLETIKNTPDVYMAGQKKWVKLAAAILIDVVGVASFALPGVGEVGDVAWAPLSAVLVQALFNNRLISLLDFVEEALPFSDIFPTACFGWSIEYTLVGAALSWVPGFPKPEKGDSDS